MVTKVSWGQGVSWLKTAVKMVLEQPVPWIGGFAAYLGANLLLSLIPLVGSLLSQIFGFVVTLFFLCYADAQRRGIAFDFDSYFKGSGQIGRLILMPIVGVLVFVIAALPLIGGAVAAGGTEFFTSQANFNAMSFDKIGSASIIMVAIGGFLSMVLAVMALAATMFATPLILFRDKSVGEAMRLSFQGVIGNLMPLIVFFVLYGLFLIVCALPLFLGLLLAIPTITPAMYLVYEDILGPRESL